MKGEKVADITTDRDETRMRRNIKGFVLVTLMLVVLSACNEKKVYDEYYHIPSSGWQRANVISFTPDSITQDGIYKLAMKLRTNNDFPFMDAVIIVDQKVRPSNMHYADTLTCKLFDEKGGTLGQGVNLYEYVFDVGKRELHQGDTLLINIRHNMRRNLLPGISDVGVQLTRE